MASPNSSQTPKLPSAHDQESAESRSLEAVMENMSEIAPFTCVSSVGCEADCYVTDKMRTSIEVVSESIPEVDLGTCDNDQQPRQHTAMKSGPSTINNEETTVVAPVQDQTVDRKKLHGDPLQEDGSLPGDYPDEGYASLSISDSETPQSSFTTEQPKVAEITENPYTVGQVFELKTPTGGIVFATVTKLYSHTMSPVMAVQLDNWTGPQEVVLKLYDRRFGNFRKESSYSRDPPVPHTAQAEAAWQRYIRDGLAEPPIKELEYESYEPHNSQYETINDITSNSDDNAEGDTEDDSEDDSEEDSEDEVDDRPEWEIVGEQEESHYQYIIESYTAEVRAYKELQELQGRSIPKFFSTVVFDMPSAQPDLPASYFQVPGILIEKINGFALCDLLENTPKDSPSLWQKISQDATDIVKKINDLGVFNDDSLPRNVVVSPLGEGRFQPYLVDLGTAEFKPDFTRRCIFNFETLPPCMCWRCTVNTMRNPSQLASAMHVMVKQATGHILKINSRYRTTKEAYPEFFNPDGSFRTERL
ncbi:hypothetical protein F4825DRAFT_476821 [Nemania diffusa]|nr:hypothetical protein F4825DRAFT_476821 [Nemania diffusa]